MANIKLDRSVVQESITNIEKYSQLLGENLKEVSNLTIRINEVYNTTGNQTSSIEQLRVTIEDIRKNYTNCLADYLKALGEIMASYELEDSRTAISIQQNGDRTVASMSVGAGAFSSLASGFDFSKISSTANDAVNGNFISKDKVHDQYFSEGDYTFEYREDGTVRIDKNGVPMAFTTKENADKITGGIENVLQQEQTSSGSFQTSSNPQVSTESTSGVDTNPVGLGTNQESFDRRNPTVAELVDGTPNIEYTETVIEPHRPSPEKTQAFKDFIANDGKFEPKQSNFNVEQTVNEIQEITSAPFNGDSTVKSAGSEAYAQVKDQYSKIEPRISTSPEEEIRAILDGIQKDSQ